MVSSSHALVDKIKGKEKLLENQFNSSQSLVFHGGIPRSGVALTPFNTKKLSEAKVGKTPLNGGNICPNPAFFSSQKINENNSELGNSLHSNAREVLGTHVRSSVNPSSSPKSAKVSVSTPNLPSQFCHSSADKESGKNCAAQGTDLLSNSKIDNSSDISISLDSKEKVVELSHSLPLSVLENVSLDLLGPLISNEENNLQPSMKGGLQLQQTILNTSGSHMVGYENKNLTLGQGSHGNCETTSLNCLARVVNCELREVQPSTLTSSFEGGPLAQFCGENTSITAGFSISTSGKNIGGDNQFQSTTSFPSGSHLPFGDLNTISHSLVSEDCKTSTLNILNGGSHKECGIKGNDVSISHATTSIIQPLVSKELPLQPFSSLDSGPNNASRDHVLFGENTSQSSFGPNSLVDKVTSQVGQNSKPFFHYPPILSPGGNLMGFNVLTKGGDISEDDDDWLDESGRPANLGGSDSEFMSKKKRRARKSRKNRCNS